MSRDSNGLPSRPPDFADEDPTRVDENVETLRAPSGVHPGTRLGNYRLLKLLGEGGMGEVWEAEQTAPVKRRVALKIIKRGLDTVAVVHRFEAERQALAMMDHPSIAKVFDAGETPTGRPYFVMELVRGTPITTYADSHRLTLEQRLRLFQSVCSAVQHAHQKAIIHRDLKPSNILVSERNDQPLATVIDFGVAKATAQPLTEGTLFTQLGQLVGTPEYMSPEQADVSAQDIDTRSDVYSLGVVLYELLVGLLPFDRDELRSAGFGGIQRILREKEPTRPSTRVSEVTNDDSGRLARARRAEPTTLVRELRGDLDWIVLKALEKERSRRYETPRDFSDDIGRHLDFQPIHARPASTMYRSSRFVRRHRVGVAVISSLAALLVGFAGTLFLQNGRISAERDRANDEAVVAQQISLFLTNLFEVSDPSEARGNNITAREILDRGAERIEGELEDQPEVQARLMASIGGVYESLGLFDDADRMLNKAWKQQESILGKNSPETIATLLRWTDVLHRQGRFAEALPYSIEAHERSKEAFGEGHPDSIVALAAHSTLLIELGQHDQAQEISARVLKLTRELHGEESREFLDALYNLEFLHFDAGRYEDAASGFERVVARHVKLLGPDARFTLTAKSTLGSAYLETGRLDQAEGLLREVLEGRRKLLGEEHDGTLMSVASLAKVLSQRGNHTEAERIAADLVATRRRVSGMANPWTAAALSLHSQELLTLGRLEEAEELAKEALDIDRKVYEPSHTAVLEDTRRLAEVWVQQKRVAEAEQLLAETAALAWEKEPAKFATAGVLRDHGKLLFRLGRWKEAVAAFERALPVYREVRAGSPELEELLKIHGEAISQAE